MALALICLIVLLLFEIDLFLILAMVSLIATMTCPIIMKPFAFVWFNLSHYFGAVISRVLLTVIFFGLVIPIGVVLKLFGKDPMYTKKWKDGSNASVLIDRNHLYTSNDIKNPF